MSAPATPLSPRPAAPVESGTGSPGEATPAPGTFTHADFEAWWAVLCKERPYLTEIEPEQKLRGFLFRDLREALRDAFEAARAITPTPTTL